MDTAGKFDLPQGTLDLLILRVVALGPIHGYAIAQRLQQVSRNALQVQQGSLYPALHRLPLRPAAMPNSMNSPPADGLTSRVKRRVGLALQKSSRLFCRIRKESGHELVAASFP